MSTTPETGFLVLADLTGYTAYLSRGELEHAPGDRRGPARDDRGPARSPVPARQARGRCRVPVRGGRAADGSLLVDALEAAYLAFRRRLRSIDQASACECNSCRLAPRLDLKLFVHHGSYVRTSIAGREELAGPDVIVAHRLLKGDVAAAARGNGFALFTDAALVALGLDPAAEGLVAGVEVIEHLGTVPVHVLDLEARWQLETAARRLTSAMRRASSTSRRPSPPIRRRSGRT